jgi:proline iminopeptidase
LSTPRWIDDTRTLLLRLSPGAQTAVAEAERTGNFTAPAYQQVVWGEWMRAHIVRQLSPEAIGALGGSLMEMNANLEILEHMWGPSDFTVTGPLKTFDRTRDLGALSMPVLFHCGEFDEALPSTVREQAALVRDSDVAIIPGAGHLTMIDAPERANDVIRHFLNRVDAGR